MFEAEDVPPQVNPAPEEDLLAKAIAMMPEHMMEAKAVDIETDPNTGEQTRRRRRRRRGESYDREVAEPLAENAPAAVVETKTLPPLDELLPESTELTGELPPVPDELQPLESLIVADEAPVKRRRTTTRRTKKVVDETPVVESETDADNVIDSSAIQAAPESEPEVTEGD